MLNFFFGFHGRIRRTNYFFGALAAYAVYGLLAASFAATSLHIDSFDDFSWHFDPSPFGIALSGVLGVIALWASLALTVKRWHDVGFTGWFSILTLPPYANGLMFLLLCLLPGTKGPNRYGADPRSQAGHAAPSAPEAVA